MKQELDEQLVKDFPLLYKQRGLPMNQTCMCWGFPGDGWEPLIRELSEKLEPLIMEVKDKSTTCFCGCDRSDHDFQYKTNPFTPDSTKCTKVFKVPFHIGQFYGCYRIPESKVKAFLLSVRRKLLREINGFLEWISPLIHKKIPSKCKKYEPYHPSASQVKEKFGTLRFYMSTETDEMSKIIDEYERKSEVTCESCGKPSKLRNCYGWVYNCCDKCWLALIKERELKHDGYCEITDEDGKECENTSSEIVKNYKRMIFVCEEHFKRYHKEYEEKEATPEATPEATSNDGLGENGEDLEDFKHHEKGGK